MKKYKYVKPSFKTPKWINSVDINVESVNTDPNAGAIGESRWINKIFVDDTTGVWQPDVYLYAEKLADELSIKEIVDVGCGSGDKLCEAFADSRYNTTGIDYAGSLEIAKAKFPQRQWVEANLSDGFAVDQIFDKYLDGVPRIYILSDVIEHILDPRLLMRQFRIVLKQSPSSRLVISTPDPVLSTSTNNNGLPRNEAHVREWPLKKLVSYLKSGGFTIDRAGYTRANLLDKKKTTNLIVVSASEKQHRATLEKAGLPQPKKTVVVTTEHADTVSTGGIGSYVKELELVCGESKPIVLYCGKQPFEEVRTLEYTPDNLIDIHEFIERPYASSHTIDWLSLSISVLEMLKFIIFMYDQVVTVEYQDYQGVGARFVEAKTAGMLPGKITARARCHGTQVYTERASQSWAGITTTEAHLLEKTSLELADEISSPTQYLLDLYTSSGYLIEHSHKKVERLPYQYPEQDIAKKYHRIKGIAFIGKRSRMKGYHDFVELVDMLTDDQSNDYINGIESVYVFGNPNDNGKKDDRRLKKIVNERGQELFIGPLPRERLLEKIREFAKDTLFILPYTSDNHPVAVLEMIENYCQFIAYGTGGIPEIVPNETQASVLCEPSADSLVALAKTRIKMSAKKNRELAVSTRRIAEKDQLQINKDNVIQYTESKVDMQSILHHKSVFSSSLVSVMVPTYNMNFAYIKELAYALDEQSLQPEEVIFVDDGSATGYSEKLSKVLTASKLRAPFKIISHRQNKGLAAARNTALKACKTKYLVNIDADDIPLNDFIYDYVVTLENNPEYQVAICGLKAFKDGEDNWNIRTNTSDGMHRFIGIGADLALGMIKNSYGHASSCVLTAKAREVGGWDATDKATWEDWSFYTKLYGSGGRIINIPKINYLYRVRGNSMLRTYDSYQGQLKVIRGLDGARISTWDSLQLFSMAQDYAKTKHNIKLMQRKHSLNMHNLKRRYSVRTALKIADTFDRVPVVKGAIGKTARYTRRVYVKARKVLPADKE